MKEIWKNISEIEGLEMFDRYEVSNMGRVRSLHKWHGDGEGILKPIVNSDGYLRVCLCANGKKKTMRVHRLVAMAFIENDNPMVKDQINHINEIKTDNRAENLEWCDCEYNINFGTRTERTCKKIYCLELEKVFPSITQASEELGISIQNISECLRKKSKTAGGYHWYYINIEEL